MRVHAYAAAATDLEEREDEIVVARVEVESELHDRPCLLNIRIRLFDRTYGGQLRQLRDRVGLEIEDDARRDVVDDDRPVGYRRDLLEVADDSACGRLVVIGRHDEEAVDAELVRAGREVYGVVGRVRARTGHDRRAVADLVERSLVQPEALVVRERRRLARRPRHDEAVRAVRDEMRRERPERPVVDRAVALERRDDRGQDLAEHVRSLRDRKAGPSMLTEFRDFLMRGNLVELAVALVMGLAFAALISSFVDNLVMPIIAMIIGKPDFSGLTFTINDAVFGYGAFITAAITFVATAAAIFFFVVKPLNALMARIQKPAADEITDEERRHQELLAAIRESGR